jgi:ribonuclease BN (tRNA processing enzyme)
MQIRVLGCSGAIAAGDKTTAFLLDDDILIDAGTGVGDLTLDELERIDHVLLSHSHLDHVLSIPLLADAVLRRRGRAQRPPIQIHALPETLAALRDHLFNGVIWPDFTRLPNAEHPVLELVPFAIGQRLHVAGREIEVLKAEHTVPAVGFAVDSGTAGHWVYTGDTGPNPALWQRLAELKLAHLIIETTFSDEERQLARISRHLCPAALGRELAQLQPGQQGLEIHITHIKPGEQEAVMNQIGALGLPHRITALRTGQTLKL